MKMRKRTKIVSIYLFLFVSFSCMFILFFMYIFVEFFFSFSFFPLAKVEARSLPSRKNRFVIGQSKQCIGNHKGGMLKCYTLSWMLIEAVTGC